MSKSKVVDKCREAFERHQVVLTGTDYEVLKAHFDDCEKAYGTRYYIDSAYRAEWGIWEACWQSRQAEIDEKNKRIEAISLILDGLKNAKYMHSQNKAYNSILIEKLEKALRGEHE